MNIGKRNKDDDYEYVLQGSKLDKVNQEKDIGVRIDDQLTFESHITEKVKKANSICHDKKNLPAFR